MCVLMFLFQYLTYFSFIVNTSFKIFCVHFPHSFGILEYLQAPPTFFRRVLNV